MGKEYFGITVWAVFVQDQHIALDMMDPEEILCTSKNTPLKILNSYDDALDYVADRDFFKDYQDEMEDRIYHVHIMPIQIGMGDSFIVDDNGKVTKVVC